MCSGLYDSDLRDAFRAVYKNTFAPTRVAELTETAFLPVIYETAAGVVGFAVLDDHPGQVAGVSKGAYMNYWEGWFKQTYGDPSANDMNTLWVVFFVTSDGYAAEALQKIVKTTFSTMTDLKNIFLLIPGAQDAIDLNAVDKVLSGYAQTGFTELPIVKEQYTSWAPADSKVLAAKREDYIAPLFIRRARVEDHDDLVAVFNAQSDVTTNVYGEYFLAELVEAQNDENRAMVAEVDGRAVWPHVLDERR
jgi:hypothetical protein